MDFEIRFEKRKGYFIIKTSGETLPDEIEEMLKKVFASKHWKKGTHLLFNNQQEITDNLSSEDVRKISQKFIQCNEILSKSKIALVMPKDFAFGLARMWESQTEYEVTFKTEIFRSIDDARKWIEEKQPNG